LLPIDFEFSIIILFFLMPQNYFVSWVLLK
jgi:hypothetical protein